LELQERFHVYILATRKDGPLYIGMTNDLTRRVFEHKSHQVRGYTERYNVDRLVYAEAYPTAIAAIDQEKRLKRWRREWKVALIERQNPGWLDLAPALLGHAWEPSPDDGPGSRCARPG
jgi:putative endonuclease